MCMVLVEVDTKPAMTGTPYLSKPLQGTPLFGYRKTTSKFLKWRPKTPATKLSMGRVYLSDDDARTKLEDKRLCNSGHSTM